ncbi:MAG: hypothetical protein R3313_00560, partial [Candidatus Saccharimonadales bacterium]|nr:hypothetical protein [Candidatus Saccharimonadales bacterium]
MKTTRIAITTATMINLPAAWRMRHSDLIWWLRQLVLIGGATGLVVIHLWWLTGPTSSRWVFWGMIAQFLAWVGLAWHMRPAYRRDGIVAEVFDQVGMWTLLVGTICLMGGLVFADPVQTLIGWSLVITFARVFI